MALAGGAGGIAPDLADFAAHIRAESELGPSAQKLIDRSIGRSRVVMLGELTHGDGTSFALKAAIVKHLHSKLGFEVLIWESGLYDCAVMDRAIGGSDPLEGVAGLGVFDHWSQSSDSFPIFEYARQSYSSGRPLRMAGFDIQPSGSASNGMLVEMIEWFGNTLSGKAKADVERRIADIRAANQESFPSAYREALKIPSILLNEYQKRRRDLDAQWGAERGFRVQALASSAKYEEMMAMVGSTTLDPSAYNLRERANAENLLFLIRQYYRGKKVIVWAHNAHLFKGLPGGGAGVKRKPIGRDGPDRYGDFGRGRVLGRRHGVERLMVVAGRRSNRVRQACRRLHRNATRVLGLGPTRLHLDEGTAQRSPAASTPSRRHRPAEPVGTDHHMAGRLGWAALRSGDASPRTAPSTGRPGGEGGAAGRTRTGDPRIFSPLLYQLSYRGTWFLGGMARMTGLEPAASGVTGRRSNH